MERLSGRICGSGGNKLGDGGINELSDCEAEKGKKFLVDQGRMHRKYSIQ